MIGCLAAAVEWCVAIPEPVPSRQRRGVLRAFIKGRSEPKAALGSAYGEVLAVGDETAADIVAFGGGGVIARRPKIPRPEAAHHTALLEVRGEWGKTPRGDTRAIFPPLGSAASVNNF